MASKHSNLTTWNSSKQDLTEYLQDTVDERAVTDHVKVSSFSIRRADGPRANGRNRSAQYRHPTERKNEVKLVRTRWPIGENLI